MYDLRRLVEGTVSPAWQDALLQGPLSQRPLLLQLWHSFKAMGKGLSLFWKSNGCCRWKCHILPAFPYLVFLG